MKVAKYLEAHPMVETVYYPGLESHPQHDIAKKQMDGFGGMIAIILKASREKSEDVKRIRAWYIGCIVGRRGNLGEHPLQ